MVDLCQTLLSGDLSFFWLTVMPAASEVGAACASCCVERSLGAKLAPANPGGAVPNARGCLAGKGQARFTGYPWRTSASRRDRQWRAILLGVDDDIAALRSHALTGTTFTRARLKPRSTCSALATSAPRL